MAKLTRRQFIEGMGAAATASLMHPRLRPRKPVVAAQTKTATHHVYVARNGTPVVNVQAVIDLAGGIESFVDYDDVVVLKPNGQWKNQGYTHTLCMKALIDVILDRPGGFGGEVIISEHVHRSPGDAMSGNYCWNMSTSNRVNNWSDMNYLELEADYHVGGYSNVTAVPMYDVSQDSAHWAAVSGPGDVPAGKHGWVRLAPYTAGNGYSFTPSYPILRSAYSDKLVDLNAGGGVWEGGSYNGQQVRLIFLPTLNNHGWGSEDYAGITSAVKCHIGFQEGTSLHSVGYNNTPSINRPDAVGESVGHLITAVLDPTFYLTCAEYSGHVSRTSPTATHTETVGLCADPVTLDCWMSKHVLYECNKASYFDPDNDNNTRKTLVGCRDKGVGTLEEGEMSVHITDINLDETIYLPLVAR